MSTHSNKIQSLDKFQTAFCDESARNLRLLAPAGSGKTHSLLHRCLSVYRRHKGSARFLIVTFTRSARDELRQRLKSADFKAIENSVEITTLNAWGWKRVRGSFNNPRLFSSSRDRSLLGNNLLLPVIEAHEALKLAKAEFRGDFGKPLVETIDLLKSLSFDHERDQKFDLFERHVQWLNSIGCSAMLEQVFDAMQRLKIYDGASLKAFHARFVMFWCAAVEHQYSQSILTLEDQKYAAARSVDNAAKAGQNPVGAARYTDILIDEFQDVNPLDLKLIRSIVRYHKANIVIVGDDDQTIYEWRGATPDFILHPDNAFDREFQTFILENNYRCPRNIVKHSLNLISHNKRREPKNIVPVATFDADIKIIRNESLSATIEEVASIVESFVSEKGGQKRRLALIARKRAQLIPYQIIFASKNITFCAAEDLQVFLNSAFDDLINIIVWRADRDVHRAATAYCNAAIEFVDKVWKYPVRQTERTVLMRHLSAARPRSWKQVCDALRGYQGPVKGHTGEAAVNAMCGVADAVEEFLGSSSVMDALLIVSKHFSGFEKNHGRAQEELFYADPPFYYLARFAERYGSDFHTFLEDIEAAKATLVQLPSDDEDSSELWTRPVHLMTALRAKGREFDTVVLLDVNDGIWPSRQAASSEQKEQERRVFYVAMTRAKEELILTINGRIGDERALESQFIREAGF